jgi:hypothetical protein
MLRSVSKSVDGLENEGLLLAQELDRGGGQGPAHTGIEADGVLLAWIADPSASMQDCRLE